MVHSKIEGKVHRYPLYPHPQTCPLPVMRYIFEFSRSSLFSCLFLYLIKKTCVFNCYSSLFSFPSLSIIYLYLGWLLNFRVLFYRMPLHMEHKISNTTDFKRVTTRDQWSSKFFALWYFFQISLFLCLINIHKGRDLVTSFWQFLIKKYFFTWNIILIWFLF